MGASFTGDWNALGNIQQNIARSEGDLAHNISKLGAELYVDIVKRNIVAQHGAWHISAAWINKKRKKGDDTRVLIDTGKFLRKIKVVQISKNMYFGGAPASEAYNEHLTMAQLAIIQEFGDREMSPHQLFGPARIEAMNMIATKSVEEIKKAITSSSYGRKE